MKPREDANRVDRILGWTEGKALGMNIQDAPHLIQPVEFQRLENARWQGSYLRPRGGQTTFNPASANPAGAGYFLWGSYGQVMQHGGIGGVGFRDEPDGETTGGAPAYGLFWSV